MDYSMIFNPLFLSIKTVGINLLLFLTIGVFLAFLLSKEKFRFKWLINTIVTLPLIFPPIAIGFFYFYY